MIEIKSDKIITPNGLKSGCVYIENELIDGFFEKQRSDIACGKRYDFSGKYVSPGFIDLHTHGAGGYPFINCSEDDVINACNFHLIHGTTSIMPTVTAGAFDTMREAVAKIAAVKRENKAKNNIIGAHLEGPYLSAKQCGAQCPRFITKPQKSDYKSIIEEFGDSIARWTYAPENDENGEFCKYLTEHGIIASAGHTDAKYEDMKTAIESGCNLVTHLYSCTSTVTRDHGFRSLGVIESTFLHDEICAEIIADGKHLPPELIQMIVKIKGADKTLLCTDSLAIAGTNIKENVLTEKPFARNQFECEELIKTACDNNVKLIVFHNTQPAPFYVHALDVMKSGILGDVKQISIRYNGFSRRWDWQTLQKKMGGSAYNTGPHPIAMGLGFLDFDENFKVVYSKLDTALTSGDAEDYVKILLTAPKKPLVDIEINSTDAFSNYTIKIQGSRGTFKNTPESYTMKYYKDSENERHAAVDTFLEDENGNPIYCRETLNVHEESGNYQGTAFDVGTAAVYENAYFAITGNAELKMPLKHAAMVVNVIEIAHAQNPLPVKFL